MAIKIQRGHITEPDVFDIEVLDQDDRPLDPYYIKYALYALPAGFNAGTEVLIGPAERTPVRVETGRYYAHFQVPENASYGDYRLRWTLQRSSGEEEVTVCVDFQIVAESELQKQLWTPIQADMIRRLRTLLRDNNPSRNYNFRPPTASGTINKYNRVFAYIWEDAELIEYMEQAVWLIDSSPPETHFGTIDSMVKGKRGWIPWIMIGAMVHACIALSLNWIEEEFSYSIGGISLSIEKSSKYQQIKQNAEGRFDRYMEHKSRTVKIMRGLQQSRYGIGIRSSFGPHVGARTGVMTPRKFIGI